MKNLLLTLCLSSVFLLFLSEVFSQTGQELFRQAMEVFDNARAKNGLERVEAYIEASRIAILAGQQLTKEGKGQDARNAYILAREAQQSAREYREMLEQNAFSFANINIIGRSAKVHRIPDEAPARPERAWITPITTETATTSFVFEVGLSVGPKPLGSLVPVTSIEQIFEENVYSNPEVFFPLMEVFGGEFVVGDITGAPQPNFSMDGSRSLMPGLGFSFSPVRNFEMGFFGSFFQSEWSGNYPLTVFSFEGGEPRLEQGFINAAFTGFLFDARAKYVFPGNSIRPYLEGGITSQVITSSNDEIQVANLTFPLESDVIDSQLSAYAGVGSRVFISHNTFMQLGLRYARFPNTEYRVGARVSVGISF